MNVAMIDPSLFTWPYDSELALALRRAGHEVLLYGSESRLREQHPGAARQLLRNHFYRDFQQKQWLSFSRTVTRIAKGIDHIFSMRQLADEFSRVRPDVIHFQWTPLPVVDHSFLPALRSIAPLVLTVHDSTPFNGTPRSFVQNWGARTIARGFDRVIVHTRTAVERIAAQGVERRKITIIPHGPLQLPAKPATSGDSRDDGKVRLLFFGKIQPYKGLDLLLKALATMPDAFANRWTLRVVGEPYMDVNPLLELARESGIHDRIEFDFRFVMESEIAGLFTAADLLVMPYRAIDASGVLMSSLAAGLPIVASRLGAFSELLTDGQHGRLFEPEDVAALASALTDLIGNPASLAYMGLQVRRLFSDIPDWDEIARRTAQLYAGARDADAAASTAIDAQNRAP